MNAALCSEVGAGAFPSPQQVLEAGPDALQNRCGVGYRAKTICGLAQQAGMPVNLSVTHLLFTSIPFCSPSPPGCLALAQRATK